MSSKKKITFSILLVIIIIAATLLITELFFRFVHNNRNKDIITKTPLSRLSQYIEPPFSWERYFMVNYGLGNESDSPNLNREGLHQPHSTRGWALKPNFSEVRGRRHFTTNSQGYRSLYEYNYSPSKYGVLIVGDSFTFGDGIDDSITWPHLLQEMDNRLNVFNLGGTGYGVDQMYITLSEEISRYRPNLVIAAFIDNDLHRSLLDFRDYKKPRFILNDNKLVLTNTPVGNVDEVMKEISEKSINHESPIQLFNVYNSVLTKLKRKLRIATYIKEPQRSDVSGGCGHDCASINEKLFEAMAELAHLNNADFLMVYLPYGEEISDHKFQSYGEFFFSDYMMRHKHFFYNPRAEFLNSDFPKSRGHYKEPENSLLTKLIYEKIQELSSWKNFRTN